MLRPFNPRNLLLCGVLLCPLFYSVVVAQMLTRPGFDISRYPLSLLSLGDAGGIQVANFVVAGLLAVACAAGMLQTLRASRTTSVAPLLVACFGLGMIVAGLCPPDPLPGFPPGVQVATPMQLSAHAKGHGAGFFIAFASLVATSLVFARLDFRWGQRGWAIYSLTTACLTPILIAGGIANPQVTSLAFFAVGIVAFGWLGVTAMRLRASVPSSC